MAGFKFKQVIVIRKDLDMGKGKLAVQASHAAVSAAEEARRRFPGWWEEWMGEGQSKIAVKVSSLDELLKVKGEAEGLGLPVALVADRGLTQLEPGTITALGIGPAPADMVDKVTGKLKLL